MPLPRTSRRPRLRHVQARLMQGRQRIGTWDVTLDPTNTAAVATLLARLLAERGIDDPTPAHRVELYDTDGAWIGELTAG
jgi:hypothetical protein